MCQNNRIEKLRKVLQANYCDAMLISKEENLHYFSGFTGDDTFLVITLNDCFLITDSRYTKQASEQTSFTIIEQKTGLLSKTVELSLLMSKKKQQVVNEMQDKTKAYQQDKLEYIKSPVVLEFLGLPEDTSLAESTLETAIINNLEKFLMEMGKGYALVARQQHIRTEENDYYIDLVFYNYLIKSFILVDLKVNRITYQDVGQMDMYLQMYDKMKKGPDDNPTIGIILCTETDSDVARYSTLAKNDQMFAAKYKLYLPDKEDLRREIERQKELYLMAHPEENDKE